MTTPTTERTITVLNCFGRDKALTKAQFITRWYDSVQDLYGLTDNMEDHDSVVAIVRQVREMASRKFDSIYATANKP